MEWKRRKILVEDGDEEGRKEVKMISYEMRVNGQRKEI